jgi:acyl-CoA reductase-like NAD-dependent aldehyde dehydrogenase
VTTAASQAPRPAGGNAPAGGAEPIGLYIDGRWTPTGAVIEDRNPARPAEIVATIALGTAEHVRAACAAARAALPAWRRTPGPERAALLHRAASLLEGRADAVGEELTREEGKTLAEGRGEVLRAVAILRYHAGEALQAGGEVYPSAVADRLLYTVREPVGVIAAITPWNFPIAIPAWKLAPALAHGNTVVLKPSEVTPLCAVRLVEALEEAGLPPGVVNLVLGEPEEVGAALVGDPDVDAISFTGSPAVGRRIQAAATARGVKVQLELGGKNPVVVLDDADVALAVQETVKGAMGSTGQKCTATSRVIVTPGIRERFVEALVARVAELTVGDPLDPATDLGPLVSARQRDTVAGYLDVAREEGHEVACGGTVPGGRDGGFFVAPTVLLDVAPDSRIGQEEIFGPVAAVMAADDLDHALSIANGVRYGLSASVFTRDLGRAFAFVRGIDTGLVHVNSETAFAEPHVPFGGMKESSSHSREQGKAAVQFYTETKTVYLDMPAPPAGGQAPC